MNEVSTPIKPGIVYILRNSSHCKTVVKIGRTKRSAERRAAELSKASGVPVPFEVLFEETVCNCERAEKLIHERLAKFRVNERREFFDMPVKDAVRAVFETCLVVNAEFLSESSRLAIWVKPDMDYIIEFMAWLEKAPKGKTAISVIKQGGTSRSEWVLSNTLLVSCTPESLTELTGEPWVQDVLYVSA